MGSTAWNIQTYMQTVGMTDMQLHTQYLKYLEIWQVYVYAGVSLIS